MADLVRAWKRAVHDPEVAALRATICNKDARIAELEAELASRPTTWAYDAACKALHHWREEAARLGKIAGVGRPDNGRPLAAEDARQFAREALIKVGLRWPSNSKQK